MSAGVYYVFDQRLASFLSFLDVFELITIVLDDASHFKRRQGHFLIGGGITNIMCL